MKGERERETEKVDIREGGSEDIQGGGGGIEKSIGRERRGRTLISKEMFKKWRERKDEQNGGGCRCNEDVKEKGQRE